MGKCYSADDEAYWDSLGAACEYIKDLKIGDIVDMWEAEKNSFNPKDFVNYYSLIENMQEEAYDEAGEMSEDWMDLNDEQTKSFEDFIGRSIDIWCKVHHQKCNFFSVKLGTEKLIKVKIHRTSYEILKEN